MVRRLLPLVLCVILLVPTLALASGLSVTTWTMGSDQQAEIRIGVAKDNGELALAFLYRDPADIGGDDGFGLRGYALYSVVDVDMIATWLGKETKLPPGELYLGGFGGVEFEDAETEGGFLVGGVLGTIRVEYQYALDRGVLPDDHMLMVGGRWEW
ncbi:MAG TPA: hypothetical protein PLU87_19055 [Sedimentisphaerales bacterium]|nr:hypothetical protein [Sedimentisphaerales bacterium]